MALNKEQEKILSEIYVYKDSGEITEDDIKTLKMMFDKPEKFALLRRVLGLLTRDERGLTMPQAENHISGKDYEDLGREVVLQRKADETIRLSLARFYSLIQTELKSEKTKEFEKENETLDKEEENKKESEIEREREERGVGDNV